MDNSMSKEFKFDKNRNIKIIRQIGRGASCITYECRIIYNDDTPAKTAILKEFEPQQFDLEPALQDDNGYRYRCLPAQKDEFIQFYQLFKGKYEAVQEILNEGAAQDPAIRNYMVAPNIEGNNYNSNFKLDESKGTYSALFLLPYENVDYKQEIKTLSFGERLDVVGNLCLIVNKFHKQKIIMADIKPENFLYYNDGILKRMEWIDFDSLLKLDDNRNLCADQTITGSPFFSAPEIMAGLSTMCDERSDVYSIGAMLLFSITYKSFNDIIHLDDYVPELPNSSGKIKNSLKELPNVFTNDLFQSIHDEDEKITLGFWNRFKNMVIKLMSPDGRKRGAADQNGSYMLPIFNEISTLLEIYNQQGLHPEVMLDHAVEKVNSEEFQELDFNPLMVANCEIENE